MSFCDSYCCCYIKLWHYYYPPEQDPPLRRESHSQLTNIHYSERIKEKIDLSDDTKKTLNNRTETMDYNNLSKTTIDPSRKETMGIQKQSQSLVEKPKNPSEDFDVNDDTTNRKVYDLTNVNLNNNIIFEDSTDERYHETTISVKDRPQKKKPDMTDYLKND